MPQIKLNRSLLKIVWRIAENRVVYSISLVLLSVNNANPQTSVCLDCFLNIGPVHNSLKETEEE